MKKKAHIFHTFTLYFKDLTILLHDQLLAIQRPPIVPHANSSSNKAAWFCSEDVVLLSRIIQKKTELTKCINDKNLPTPPKKAKPQIPQIKEMALCQRQSKIQRLIEELINESL